MHGKWEDVVQGWCDKTFPGSGSNYVGGHVQGDSPMFNSECGNVWGYKGSAGDCDFTWDYHMMMNAFRRRLKCVLSWFSQKRDKTLSEAGSYGWLVEAAIPASVMEKAKDGKLVVRLEAAEHGLAVYGGRFGRYPFDPHVEFVR